MIPFILAAVGGYLIGDSMKDSEKFADGGMMTDGGMMDGSAIESAARRKADNPNWTNEKLLAEYQSLTIDLEDLKEGKITPRKIIGGGYKSSVVAKKIAKQWLEDRIAEYKMALEMRGVMADGGIMADGGQFDYGFTIRGMNEILRNKFPDSFGFSVYPLNNDYTVGTLKRGETESYKGLSDADIKSKLYFPQYKRDHEINYHITQGGENTYFDFLLEDENGNGYVGTFGFKDQGMVPASYITEFIAFLQEAYGLPFTIEHTVK